MRVLNEQGSILYRRFQIYFPLTFVTLGPIIVFFLDHFQEGYQGHVLIYELLLSYTQAFSDGPNLGQSVE